MDNEYYQNYKGPKLTKAVINNINITEKIQKYYGNSNNWNRKLWKYNEIFNEYDIGSKFYCEFKSDEGRIHWFYGFINDKEEYFNPPLAKSIRIL